jgi:hypothetical protein
VIVTAANGLGLLSPSASDFSSGNFLNSFQVTEPMLIVLVRISAKQWAQPKRSALLRKREKMVAIKVKGRNAAGMRIRVPGMQSLLEEDTLYFFITYRSWSRNEQVSGKN